jgi:hypothetical protein
MGEQSIDSTVTTTAMPSPEPAVAAPPSVGPPSSATEIQPAPRKRRLGCLIALLVAFVLVVLAAIGIAVVIGAATSPDDLGVTYSEADFDSVVAKAGVVWPELPEGADPNDYERVYSGEKPLDVTLTAAEISALMAYRHSSSYWPLKSVQVQLTGGDGARMSAVVAYAGRDWPVSASGSGGISGTSLDVSIASASVAGIDVPAQYLPLGEAFLEELVSSRLARIPGFGIDSLEVTDEGVHLVGTTWEPAEYVEPP